MATFFLMDVFNIFGVGVVIVGQVKSGTIRPGMKLNLAGKTMEIKTMELKRMQLKEAQEGENLAISLAHGDYKLLRNYKNKHIEFY